MAGAHSDRGLVHLHRLAGHADSQRSLSGHLFQSVAWTIIFTPFALDPGGSSYLTVIAAVGVWTVSVLATRVMDGCRYRGPAEHPLRRLTYRPVGPSPVTLRSPSIDQH
jgi:uncharacterized membrane protein YeiB